MMKPLALAFAGALLLPAAAAAAQDVPSAAQAPDTGDEDLVALLREAVAEMRRAMYGPGPAVEGWDQGGADPDAEVRQRGADGHVLLLSSRAEPSVVMLTARPIADFAPAGWRIVDSYGAAGERLETPFVQFSALTPRYVLAARANSRRTASVDCTDPVSHAILYEVPDAPPSADDESLPFFFRIALLAGEGQVVCTRYDRDGDGWRLRSFLPDGRSLPQLDEEGETLSIVPAAPVDVLLARARRAGTPS